MKGGKDVEKKMSSNSSPLFPRLHVNDTEKGGPRAPPRNKMALYEQLSIPSQRFNSGWTGMGSGGASSTPVRQSSENTASPSQEGGHQRATFPPFYHPVPAQSVEKPQSHCSEGGNLNTNAVNILKITPKTADGSILNPPENMALKAGYSSFGPHQRSKSKTSSMNKFGNEDDFRVPTFVHSGFSHNNSDGERNSPLKMSCPNHSMVSPGICEAATASCSSTQHAGDKHLKRTNTTDLRSRQFAKNLGEQDCPSINVQIGEQMKHSITRQVQENTNIPFVNFGGISASSKHLQHKHGARFVPENSVQSDDISPEMEDCVEDGNHISGKNDSYYRNSTGPPQVCDVDKNEDISETWMVDSVSGIDISPDDVVGVIGQKHFWKARRAIVNQQRLFAVQVFELHRLIKVQKLIAGSPHLLLEDTIKVHSTKKPPSKYGVDLQTQIKLRAASSPKPIQECAAENSLGNISIPLPSASDNAHKGVDNHGISNEPNSGNRSAAHTAAENKMNPGSSSGSGSGWGFHPPPGNQWLVPMMTHSEGFVYKPFTGPCPPTAGFMAPVYGGDYTNPSYMMPSHPHVPYFPPYGMQNMNPQVTPFSGSQGQPYGQNSQLSSREVNMQKSRNSCNVSKQSGTSHKAQTSKENELQGSTASNPFEKAEKGGRDLPLFPVNPPPNLSSNNQQQQQTQQQQKQARVIRVVPHNRRSATESAARIFQSIQEERQQHDSG